MKVSPDNAHSDTGQEDFAFCSAAMTLTQLLHYNKQNSQVVCYQAVA